MNSLALVSAALGLVMFVPLIINVWRRAITQNLGTFCLWGLLNLIAALSIYNKGGNYALPAMYVLACVGVIAGILRARTFKWTWLEWASSGLVVICLVIWSQAGDREATIASTLALCAAGVPQMVDFWKKPREAPILTYLGFALANAISIFAGTDWSVEQRFYPTVTSIWSLLFVVVASRRFLMPVAQVGQPRA